MGVTINDTVTEVKLLAFLREGVVRRLVQAEVDAHFAGVLPPSSLPEQGQGQGRTKRRRVGPGSGDAAVSQQQQSQSSHHSLAAPAPAPASPSPSPSPSPSTWTTIEVYIAALMRLFDDQTKQRVGRPSLATPNVSLLKTLVRDALSSERTARGFASTMPPNYVIAAPGLRSIAPAYAPPSLPLSLPPAPASVAPSVVEDMRGEITDLRARVDEMKSMLDAICSGNGLTISGALRYAPVVDGNNGASISNDNDHSNDNDISSDNDNDNNDNNSNTAETQPPRSSSTPLTARPLPHKPASRSRDNSLAQEASASTPTPITQGQEQKQSPDQDYAITVNTSTLFPAGSTPPSEPIFYDLSAAPDVLKLWEEWTVGLDGGPSVSYLEATFGARWRPTMKQKVKYCRRKVIIEEILRVQQRERSSLAAAVARVEADRAAADLSLNQLHDRIKQRMKNGPRVV